ncbi:MAG: peptidyl-prolyl cis-trans isomerase [Myxococcales bacterium]|nr:peptidyl-prolyl cis-trans isomerase [Myxococcales bacterium]
MIVSSLLAVLISQAPAEETIVLVNDEPITASQLRSRAAATRAKGGGAQASPLVEDLINEALLAQEGYRLGLARDPEVVSQVQAETRRLAAKLLVEREISQAVELDDKLLLEMYHSTGDSARLEGVVVATEEQARAVFDRLKKGAKMADEARHSLDPNSAARGGDLGVLTRGGMAAALADAVFAAKAGELVGPVKQELGWVVARVVTLSPADPAGFEKRKADIRRFAESQARSQARYHYTQQLRKAAGVKLDEEFLRSTGIRLDATPKELDHVVVTAGGRKIRYAEVLEKTRELTGGRQGGHMTGPSVKMDLAWGLVEKALLEEAALKRGLGADPSVREAARVLERDRVIALYADRLRKGVPVPGSEEVEAWYRSHPGEFKIPAVRSCSHIVVANRGIADRVKQKLAAGEPFEELARAYSVDPDTAAKGGGMGPITDDHLAAIAKAESALAAAIRDAKPGKVSEPARSQMGWHLVRCGEVTPAGREPIEKVRAAIQTRIAQEKGDTAVRQRFEELRGRARISKNAAALERATRTN